VNGYLLFSFRRPSSASDSDHGGFVAIPHTGSALRRPEDFTPPKTPQLNPGQIGWRSSRQGTCRPAWTHVSTTVLDSLRLLTDGRVMGSVDSPTGATNEWDVSHPDSAGNYAMPTLTAIAPMNVPRYRFDSDILPNGDYLVIGGNRAATARFTPRSRMLPKSTTRQRTHGPRPRTFLARLPPKPGYYFAASTELLANGYVLAPHPIGQTSYLFNPNGTDTDSTWVGGVVRRRSDTGAQEGTVLLQDGSVLSVDIHSTADPTTGPGNPAHPELYSRRSGTS